MYIYIYMYVYVYIYISTVLIYTSINVGILYMVVYVQIAGFIDRSTDRL